MTTTEPTVDPVDPVDTDAVEAESPEPELCWLNLADLAPHPDNPRSGLPCSPLPSPEWWITRVSNTAPSR
jgi:hypothetical protein